MGMTGDVKVLLGPPDVSPGHSSLPVPTYSWDNFTATHQLLNCYRVAFAGFFCLRFQRMKSPPVVSSFIHASLKPQALPLEEE